MPGWIEYGRSKIGQREIAGPKHNSWIMGIYVRLKLRWITSDEVPWCGTFVADCMDRAGLPLPKAWYRAVSWATYGVPCKAVEGAIGVKARKGGNHVFFIVGQTEDRTRYKVLQGNAGNMVCEGDIRKSDVTHIRWPSGVPMPTTPLPFRMAGTISTREA